MSTTDLVDLIPKPFSSYVKSVNGVQMRISASTEYSSAYAAWRACTSVSSRYLDSYQWIPHTSAAGWWMIDLGKKYPIGAFSFYEVRHSTGSSIKDYTIDISLDGSTFKTIYSETLTEAPSEVWQVSRKINTVYARYFRISILTKYSGSTWCGILSYVQIFRSEGYKCLFISNDQVYALKS